MATMNQSPPREVPQEGLANSEITCNKHQADPYENIKPASLVSSSVSVKSGHSMSPPLKFQKDSQSTTSMKPTSPVSDCVSMKSNHSMDPPMKFQKDSSSIPRTIQQESSHTSAPSCVSFKSDKSMEQPFFFNIPAGHRTKMNRGKPRTNIADISESMSCMSIKSDNSMDYPLEFQGETSQVFRAIQQESSHTPAPSCASFKSDRSMESPVFLNKPAGPRCPTLPYELCMELKSNLKQRFQLVSGGLRGHGHSTLLNDIYTELYIMEGGSGEVNNEHEVRQIETTSRVHQSADEVPIQCNDIFKPLQGHERFIKTVLTTGVAGIGKTVSVQKFILDWAEGTANQDINFIISLPFRELNLMKDQSLSLEELVHHFVPQLKEIKFTNVTTHKILFIFDGLDEHRFTLDFPNSTIVSEVNFATSVDLLLTNLIKGNLLPSALIWITSRPAAARQIPYEWISQVTEIRGFNNPQKEEYLKKTIRDRSLANDVIKHLKLSRSLYIMCHIPVFCWISATVLEKMLKEADGNAIPKTLTQMYTHFLIIQTSIKKEKYNQIDDREIIIKLGELAFKQLLKGNLIFYEEDLTECGINVMDAVMYSGVCTRIFIEDFELLYSKGKVFCFVHLSIQEHLAALYVHIAFCNGDKTVLNQWSPTNCACTFSCSSLTDLHKSAVDKTLQCKNGQFDLFLRFLLGISQENNLALLQMLIPCSSQSVQDTIDYIKIRLRMQLNPEKYINLFHCLNELNDFSLEEEIQNFQSSRRLAKTKLSSSQWSALVFVLLTSGKEMDVFDLRKYSMNNADECLQRMLPVVMVCKTAEVRNCNLLQKGFQALTSALSSKSSNLRELKLSDNELHQSDLKILSEGLQSPHCKLEILELSECSIQAEDCSCLFSALNLNPSHLRELDLSFNFLGQLGIKLLSEYLQNPQCRLEILKLISCELNSQSCINLAAALHNNSSLIKLDLSRNALKYYGAQWLSEGLGNPSCKLRVLRLADCGINKDGCRLLCKALNSNPSHLSELCLNRNSIGDNGVKHISDFLSKSCCKLEKLSLSYCSVADSGYTALVSALKRNPSHLKDLELIGNQAGTPGWEQLSALQKHKDYRLEKFN